MGSGCFFPGNLLICCQMILLPGIFLPKEEKNMKRMAALFLTLILLLGCVGAVAVTW